MKEQNTASSRRRFLQKAGLTLGGAALAAPGLAAPGLVTPGAPSPVLAPTGRPARRRRDEPLGFALVGLGNYATNQLAPALQETERCKLTGIVTGSPEKVPEWKEKYGIPDENVYSYDTFDAIAENDAIDVVYVVLPNGMHAEYSVRAAQAGKHVLCEKPMATSVDECRRMIEACERAGTKLAIGYRLHFEPHHRRAMEIGQEQVYGPIKLVEASFAFKIGDPDQWRLDRELSGGGALMDVGIYAVQAARYTTGEEPVAVTAQAFKTDPEKFDEVEETLLWQLEFPSGAAATSSTSYAVGVNRLFATAPEGRFEIEPAYGYGGIEGTENGEPMGLDSNVNQQARQMDGFAECVLEDKDPAIYNFSGEEGLKDVKIMEAIYQAAESGERVEIS